MEEKKEYYSKEDLDNDLKVIQEEKELLEKYAKLKEDVEKLLNK